MGREVKVMIADDHPIFRQGLRQIIERNPRFEVAGEAQDGESALDMLAKGAIDIAILDLDMPRKDGFDVVRAIAQRNWAVKAIILTMHKDERFLNAALDLGVKGFVIKDSAVTEIVDAIKCVSEGSEYVSPGMAAFLISRIRRSAALAAQVPQIRQLSPTERHILRLVADYKTSKEIAGELRISVRTVEHHRANIGDKLNLKGSHALLKFAVEHKAEL